MVKRKIIRLFESRKGHLEYRVKRDFIRNGIAVIPCRISEYSDVISTYSVKGYETLNPDFYEYLETTADVTPSDSPIVLHIIEDCLSQEERETIEETILDDCSYNLGIVEKEERRHTRIFAFTFLGLIIFGIILLLTKSLAEEPRELLFIPFWFMGETLCDYIFLAGYDIRRSRRLAGRIASIKVVFSDKYEDLDYTEGDVEKLYSDIEKDVKRNKSVRLRKR